MRTRTSVNNLTLEQLKALDEACEALRASSKPVVPVALEIAHKKVKASLATMVRKPKGSLY